MAKTPPSANQSPNNGKSNAGETPNAGHLNMSPPPPATDKGKETMVEATQQPPNPNKRKSIILGEPVHHPPMGDDEHLPKIPRTDGTAALEAEGGNIIPPSLRQKIRGTCINPTRVNNVPQVYICEFCNKRFPSPQALGGHQNGHRLERQMRSEMEAMNKAMEQQTLPSLMAITGTYGPSFTQMNLTNHYLPSGYSYNNNNNNNNNNPMMMNPTMTGYGNHHQQNGVPINGTTPRLEVAVATAGGAIMPHGNNTTTALFYPQWASGDGSIWNNGTGVNYLNPGYETGYCNSAGGYYGSFGALDSGYGGAIYYPQGSLYNYPEFETGYYNGAAADGSSYYGAFQQPDPAWINQQGGILIPSTGYYVGIDNNTYGLYQGQVDAMAYDPLQQGVTGILSGNDYLRYQNTGGTQQQVAMVAMDFGSIPEAEAGHGGPENIQEEEEGIDLTLRL